MNKIDYEPVIGLEVHVQLRTESKIFCGCSTKFGSLPNTQVCPVCLGLPGVLPVLNKKAVQYAIMTALSINCSISTFSKFDRKNYFYPDLPKAFQISQYDKPLTYDGWINISNKKIRIKRAHLEEDAGKLIHNEESRASFVDYNRTGMPLLEIVTEPDIKSPEEAHEYLTVLKQILEYLDVSDCNMEEGSLRCDANVSIRPKGETILGVKTEVKNMNSFKGVQKALNYEILRQKKALEEGGKITQETRLWDPDTEVTHPMRSKEEAHDYRYFPEPDLVPIEISQEMIEEIKKTLPEMPAKKKERFVKQYNLPEYDAGVLTSGRKLSEYFESAVQCGKKGGNPKLISNWIMAELLREINACCISVDKSPVPPRNLNKLIELIEDSTISGKIAKDVFIEMFKTGKDPESIVKDKGLVQITDASALGSVIDKVIEANGKSVSDYKAGKESALMFLVGQTMKESKGKANPVLVQKLLRDKLQGV
jgi:aspartyl-tRNA(Asn)/glutamyl-tRNA(Gln) amidotransferase subunit B